MDEERLEQIKQEIIVGKQEASIFDNPKEQHEQVEDTKRQLVESNAGILNEESHRGDQ